MKLVKSLLLAAPATIVAAVAAQAADLPSREAAPIQYVRICDAYGSGFFFIPGTNTCLYVGGYVRVEGEYTPGQAVRNAVTRAVTQVGADQDTTGLEVRGRIDVDARTQTPWGTAQTVVWLRGTTTDGIKALGSTNSTVTAIGAGSATPGYVPTASGAASLSIERAYIRFAGLTAGVSTENFIAMPGQYMYDGMFAGFPNGAIQLAYTATFGGGFSSTIALESRVSFTNDVGVGQYTYIDNPSTGYNLVLNVRDDASWGFVQLQGALGGNSFRNNLTAIPNSVTLANNPTNSLTTGASSLGAYAIGGTVKINLPWSIMGPVGIGPGGDALYINGAYAHGMDSLTGCTFATSSCNDATNRRMDGGVLRFDSNLIPVGLNGAGNPVFGTENTSAIGAMLVHYWSPTWRSNLAFQYEYFQEPTAAASVGLQLGNASEYGAGAMLIWSPTANFDIGLELDYFRLDQAQFQNAGTLSTAGLDEGNWGAHLRLERAF